jgi:hypothetical protein
MWVEMEEIARQITFRGKTTSDFVVNSCTYGRLKHAIVAQAWTLILLTMVGDYIGVYDKERIRKAIATYDDLWKQWKRLDLFFHLSRLRLEAEAGSSCSN